MTRRQSFTVVDQAAKMSWLVDVRRDQRPPCDDDPRRISAEWLGTHNWPKDNNVAVDCVRTLSAALTIERSSVDRWMSGARSVSKGRIPKLCQIFAVECADFIKLNIDLFKSKYPLTNAVSPSAAGDAFSNWRVLLRAKAICDGELLDTDPFAGPNLKYPSVRKERFVRETAFRVPVETNLWMRFRCLPAPGGANRWSGWHLLLLNHDRRPTVEAFKCYLPAYSSDPAFAIETFPERGDLTLPRQPILSHPVDDVGQFEWVLVVAREPFPNAVLATLSCQEVYGSGIEAELRALAAWLEKRLRDGNAAIHAVSYEVVPNAGRG